MAPTNSITVLVHAYANGDKLLWIASCLWFTASFAASPVSISATSGQVTLCNLPRWCMRCMRGSPARNRLTFVTVYIF